VFVNALPKRLEIIEKNVNVKVQEDPKINIRNLSA